MIVYRRHKNYTIRVLTQQVLNNTNIIFTYIGGHHYGKIKIHSDK